MNNFKRLFLIDGLGAITSTGMLYFLVAGFEDLFGIPKNILHILALIAAIFAVYSLCCHFLVQQSWKTYLLIIAIANSCYSILTLGVVFSHYDQITTLGLLYFIGEILIIVTLVTIELRAVLKK